MYIIKYYFKNITDTLIKLEKLSTSYYLLSNS